MNVAKVMVRDVSCCDQNAAFDKWPYDEPNEHTLLVIVDVVYVNRGRDRNWITWSRLVLRYVVCKAA